MAVRLEKTIQRYLGLSTDTKPENAKIGSLFFETDTRNWYKCSDGTNWVLLDNYSVGTGVLQIGVKTIDLNQSADTYDLFIGSTQPVIVEKLNVKMPTGDCGGDLTSISIKTNSATPATFIDSTLGAVGNLKSEADISWIGNVVIPVGKKIQLTIAGGAHGSEYIATVYVQYRAVAAGGRLL